MGAILSIFVVPPGSATDLETGEIATDLIADWNSDVPERPRTAEEIADILRGRMRPEHGEDAAIAISLWIQKVGEIRSDVSINSRAIGAFEDGLAAGGLGALLSGNMHGPVPDGRPRCSMIPAVECERLLAAAEALEDDGSVADVVAEAIPAIADALRDAMDQEYDLVTVWS